MKILGCISHNSSKNIAILIHFRQKTHKKHSTQFCENIDKNSQIHIMMTLCVCVCVCMCVCVQEGDDFNGNDTLCVNDKVL